MNIIEYLDKKKYFEFYILKISSQDSNYKDIINIFQDAIINAYIEKFEKYTIIYSTIINNDINHIANAIEVDFGLNIKVFKSNKLSCENISKIDTLKQLYFKYEHYLNSNYISTKELLQIIMEKDINDLEYLKPIILYKINNDSKLLEIIEGMFINDLNVCKTANYVYMHRNTINNKLQVIKEETGLDIQKFKDAVILYVLIKR